MYLHTVDTSKWNNLWWCHSYIPTDDKYTSNIISDGMILQHCTTQIYTPRCDTYWGVSEYTTDTEIQVVSHKIQLIYYTYYITLSTHGEYTCNHIICNSVILHLPYLHMVYIQVISQSMMMPNYMYHTYTWWIYK